MEPFRIDLNADVGEGFADHELIPLVSSANLACGAHAGDEITMRETVRLAVRHGVALGAHPGFPDREGFGRQVSTTDAAAIQQLVLEQVMRLARIADQEGAVIRHVKPHGALYNLAARDPSVSTAVVLACLRAGSELRTRLTLFGLAKSPGLEAARELGIPTVAEGFADRGYLSDGTLAPRGTAGALIEDPELAGDRAVRLVLDRRISALDGSDLEQIVETICVHGDTPRAAEIARSVRAALVSAGVSIEPPAPQHFFPGAL